MDNNFYLYGLAFYGMMMLIFKTVNILVDLTKDIVHDYFTARQNEKFKITNTDKEEEK